MHFCAYMYCMLLCCTGCHGYLAILRLHRLRSPWSPGLALMSQHPLHMFFQGVCRTNKKKHPPPYMFNFLPLHSLLALAHFHPHPPDCFPLTFTIHSLSSFCLALLFSPSPPRTPMFSPSHLVSLPCLSLCLRLQSFFFLSRSDLMSSPC